jgi:hypothetical protein
MKVSKITFPHFKNMWLRFRLPGLTTRLNLDIEIGCPEKRL